MSPYEIRLELLKMAQGMLEQDYNTRREQTFEMWNASKNENGWTTEKLEFPKFFSEQEVIEKAKVLNSFISNKNDDLFV